MAHARSARATAAATAARMATDSDSRRAHAPMDADCPAGRLGSLVVGLILVLWVAGCGLQEKSLTSSVMEECQVTISANWQKSFAPRHFDLRGIVFPLPFLP